MKFALNGALTMGTYDGANIEILNAVGAENFYLFGATAEEVNEMRSNGDNNRFYRQSDPRMMRIVNTLISGEFSADREIFAPLHHMLTTADHYCHLLDFDSYSQTQRQAMADFEHPRQWHRKALLNISRMGEFSSDRTIQGYARDIWGINC